MRFLQSEIGADPIVIEGVFPAPPEKVFAAFTEPEQVMKWFGPKPGALHSAEIDLREGGKWRFVESLEKERTVAFEGTYLEIERNQRLVFSWAKVVYEGEEREDSGDSRVEITFDPHPEGTRVRLIHSQIDDETMRRGFGGGWERGLGNLSAHLSNT